MYSSHCCLSLTLIPTVHNSLFFPQKGDFQYKETRVDAPVILEKLRRKLANGTTLYIATDERDKAFFQPIRDQYDVVFLDDFIATELVGVNSE